VAQASHPELISRRSYHDHWRAWKGFDWDALSRLYEKGLIGDPVNKAKSVVFTEDGLKRAEELFLAMFTKPD